MHDYRIKQDIESSIVFIEKLKIFEFQNDKKLVAECDEHIGKLLRLHNLLSDVE
jgi:hypothetical protein